MFKSIGAWFIQIYLKHKVGQHRVITQTIFDYKKGQWEVLISGLCNKQNNNQLDTLMDQLYNQGLEKTLVVIMHSTQEGGFIIAANEKRQHYEKFFLADVYELPEAFYAIAQWCEGSNNGTAKMQAR